MSNNNQQDFSKEIEDLNKLVQEIDAVEHDFNTKRMVLKFELLAKIEPLLQTIYKICQENIVQFWFSVLSNSTIFDSGDEQSEQDLKFVQEHLREIEVKLGKPGVEPITITLKFSENNRFSNKEITRTLQIAKSEQLLDPTQIPVEVTKIDWKREQEPKINGEHDLEAVSFLTWLETKHSGSTDFSILDDIYPNAFENDDENELIDEHYYEGEEDEDEDEDEAEGEEPTEPQSKKARI